MEAKLELIEAEIVTAIIKKKKKNDKVPPLAELVEVKENKKSKKRKLDAQTADDVEEPKPKKKLNVLMQIEDPSQRQGTLRQANTTKSQNDDFFVPMAAKKLKKIIPEKLDEKNKEKKKKKKGKGRIIPEPSVSLPRPVWTSAGTFIEEPISPFKFQSTNYVPINSSTSTTKFGVVVFEGKQKKKKQTAQQQPADFKTQAMFRNMKARDGSSKNIQGLLGLRKN